MADPFDQDEEDERPRGAARRVAWAVAVILIAAVAFYYPIGMLLLTRIDDDPDFRVDPPAGASRAVATAAALVEREVDTYHWAANDPFFLPGALLDNMPAYQTGIVTALARVLQVVNEQIARTGGRGRVDADLDRGVGLLRYPGNVWIFQMGTGSATSSSETQYRSARKALLAYNERLAAKRATFDRRPEALAAVLDAVAQDLDTYIALLDKQVGEQGGNLLDLGADDLYYAAKGRMYGYALMLRDLGADFDKLLGERGLMPTWTRMAGTLRDAASLHPWVVMNGAPDSVLLPSHLAGQAYALMRAKLRVDEVKAALGK